MKWLPLIVLGACAILLIVYPGLLLGVVFHSFQYENAYEIDILGPSLLLAYLAVTVAYAWFRMGKVRLHRGDLSFSLLAMLVVLGTFYSPDLEASLPLLGRFIFVGIGYYGIGRVHILSSQNPDKYLVHFGSTVVLLTLLFGFGAWASADRSGRLSIGEGGPIGFSQAITTSLIFCITYYLFAVPTARKRLKKTCTAVAGMSLLVLAVASGTRGLVVSVVLCVIVISTFNIMGKYRNRSRTVRWVLVGLPTLIGITILLFREYSARSEILTTGIRRLVMNFADTNPVDTSSVDRWQRILAGLRIGVENPSFGAGFGSYDHLTGYGYPHNLFVEMFAQLGLVGVAVTLIMVLTYLHIGIKITKLSNHQFAVWFATAMFIAALLHQQFSFTLWMAKPMFLAMGCMSSLLQRSFTENNGVVLDSRDKCVSIHTTV